jgi:hypothetical protein
MSRISSAQGKKPIVIFDNIDKNDDKITISFQNGEKIPFFKSMNAGSNFIFILYVCYIICVIKEYRSFLLYCQKGEAGRDHGNRGNSFKIAVNYVELF